MSTLFPKGPNFSEIGRQNLAKLEQNEKLLSADALVMTVGFFAVVCSYASLYANNLRPPQKKIAMVCILAKNTDCLMRPLPKSSCGK